VNKLPFFLPEKRYNDHNSQMKEKFGGRVQKVLINAGFTCPNRDGTKGRGGCTYCNNKSFSPSYCHPKKSVTEQINDGIHFFRKYKSQSYFAYFQTYSNTYASLDKLKKLYAEALAQPKVIGLVIGTRPDCVDTAILDYLEELAQEYFIQIEYGIESTNDKTLELINRCHSHQETIDTIENSANRGLHIGAHLILGLPGESRDDILNHAKQLSKLPIDVLKVHQLQIVKDTIMEKQFAENPDFFSFRTAEEYIQLVCDFIERLNPSIALERFVSEAPSDLLIAPKWGLKNYAVVHKIEKELKQRDSWQGKKH